MVYYSGASQGVLLKTGIKSFLIQQKEQLYFIVVASDNETFTGRLQYG